MSRVRVSCRDTEQSGAWLARFAWTWKQLRFDSLSPDPSLPARVPGPGLCSPAGSTRFANATGQCLHNLQIDSIDGGCRFASCSTDAMADRPAARTPVLRPCDKTPCISGCEWCAEGVLGVQREGRGKRQKDQKVTGLPGLLLFSVNWKALFHPFHLPTGLVWAVGSAL